MSASGIITRNATSAELGTVTDLCLAAFADEAVTAWLIPDPGQRQNYMRQMFSASLETVITTGSLIIATDSSGVPVAASIWLRPTTTLDEPKLSAAENDEDDDPQAQRMAAVEAATQARRPDDPHLHLSSMATLPDHRGRGAGAAMLTAGLERARTLELPVYLEASTSDNRRLYERFGFRDIGEPINLPDGGPSLQPMWLDT